MMNANERVYAYNEVSGKVDLVPRRFLTHPNLGKNLKEVSSGKRRARIKAEIDIPAPTIQSEEEVEATHAFEDPLEGKDD